MRHWVGGDKSRMLARDKHHSPLPYTKLPTVAKIWNWHKGQTLKI
jgi:hypothetical protein